MHIDHELNHIFGKLTNDFKKYKSLDDKLSSQIMQYLNDHDIIEYNELISQDFSIHMFSQIEFISMLSNVCNVISLMFNEKDNIKVLTRFMHMTSEEFINSAEFKKLEEPIRGAIIFAFICRKFNPDRWNRVMKAIKEQLNLTGISGSIKLLANKIKENLKGLFKKNAM